MDAFKREMREETGLQLSEGKVFYCTDAIFTNQQLSTQQQQRTAAATGTTAAAATATANSNSSPAPLAAPLAASNIAYHYGIVHVMSLLSLSSTQTVVASDDASDAKWVDIDSLPATQSLTDPVQYSSLVPFVGRLARSLVSYSTFYPDFGRLYANANK